MQKEFLFGSSYCPYAKSEDIGMEFWERDVATMKKLNLNTVRFFIAWDRIERQEGVFDYSKSDYMFDLCEKYGIKVILAIGGMFDNHVGRYAPHWLATDPLIQQQTPVPGGGDTPFGPLRFPCPDDPVYTAKAKEFTVRTIRRYAGRTALAGWSVWNEAFTREYCHCPLTLQKFREFLREKYGTIEKLLAAWETECPLNYHDWEEVEPSLNAGYLGGSFRSGMDFIEFHRKQTADRIDEVDKLVRQNDPRQLPTTTNAYCGTAFVGVMHKFPNMFDQNRGRSIPGYSSYNNYIANSPEDQYQMAEAFSMLRGCSKTGEKEFWILETEAGLMTSMKKNRKASEMTFRTAAHFQAVLHGATAILLWKYSGRMSDALSLSCMLTGWDGSVTSRAEEAANFAVFLKKHQELFLSRRYHAKAAILSSQTSEIFGIIDNSFARMVEARHGAYRLLHDLGIQADIIDEVQLKNGGAEQYRVLIVPSTPALDNEGAEKLRSFVRSGGHLIIDRYSLIYDENSRREQSLPGFGLGETFGAFLHETHFTGDDETVVFNEGQSLPLGGEISSYVQLKSAKSEAEYSDGGCAVSAQQYGEGCAILCGTALFNQYTKQRDAGIRALFARLFSDAGLEPEIMIEGDPEFRIHFGTINNPGLSNLHILINFSDSPVSFRLTLKSGGIYHDLRSSFQYTDPADITMLPYQVMVLNAQ